MFVEAPQVGAVLLKGEKTFPPDPWFLILKTHEEQRNQRQKARQEPPDGGVVHDASFLEFSHSIYMTALYYCLRNFSRVL